MGNFQFGMSSPPQRGQICTIVETPFAKENKLSKETIGFGTKVKVIGSKNLLCSRPSAPPVTVSVVQLPTGQTDVYLSNFLRPVQ